MSPSLRAPGRRPTAPAVRRVPRRPDPPARARAPGGAAVVVLVALAAVCAPRARAELAGSWAGTIEGASAVMRLEREGTTVTGSIAVADAIMLSIRAEGTADHATGVMTLLENEFESAVELTVDGDVLTLVEHGSDLRTGEERQTAYVLHRLPPVGADAGGAGAASGSGGPAADDATADTADGSMPASGSSPPPPNDGIPREPCFTGVWRWSASYTSGTFTSVVESFLQLDADGRAWAWDGAVAAGDAGSSVVQPGDGTRETGWWKIEEGVLLLAPADGSGTWEPRARVSCSDEAMLWTYEDGSKRLWYRQ